ncbi:hypothetical protein As57867_005555, partial [Aphanomyces stellatus]
MAQDASAVVAGRLPDQQAMSAQAYKSLLGWCQAFAHRHGFSQRVPCASKKTQAKLVETREEYAKAFWKKYAAYEPSNIINIDETCPPGARGLEVTAVLAVRADGRKLPPLVIVHGKPGGPVEQTELPTYPRGAVY